MTTAELIAEGEAITRPAFVLGEQPTDSGVVAYWDGIRSDVPNEVPAEDIMLDGRRHICTVSDELLARLGIAHAPRPTGPISLFEIDRAGDTTVHRAQSDYRQTFRSLKFSDAIPLYATTIRSFPPFAALCYHGSEKIGSWLAGQGYARHEYWLADRTLTGEYDQEWQRRSPFYDPAAVATVGGWHMLWPEDEFYAPPEYRLLFITQRDAEPWLEVWRGLAGGGISVKERIT